MKISQLASRTTKNVAADEISKNAQLLTRAGFVHKLMAGVYTYLPLGLMALNKIENIVREEMNALGANEILMPALQPREIWDATQRWDAIDVLFKLKGAGDRDLALGPTHEEVVTPLMGTCIKSYRDLPLAVYQIQNKFRNEARAKSGLLRGREFRMKDLYSFHTDQADLDAYYDRATAAYHRVYARCGLGDRTLLTYASGGAFSKYSHEFQTLTEAGEDIVYRLPGTNIAINKEIIDDAEAMANIRATHGVAPEAQLEECKAIEVGNIFKLGTRFSDACGVKYTDREGKVQPVIMGCYGIGPSRLLGTIAEVLADERGLIWPAEIAPFKVHLVSLAKTDDEAQAVAALYAQLQSAGLSVLFDDRAGVSAGEKLADADLLGMPHRVVVGAKSLTNQAAEWKPRPAAEAQLVPLAQLVGQLQAA